MCDREASEMVTVPRAELHALRAEVRRLRREVGRSVARARMEADPGPGDAALTLSRSALAEAWGLWTVAFRSGKLSSESYGTPSATRPE